MSVDVTEWQPRRAVELFQEPVPPYSGTAWTAAGFGDDEHPHETGGNPPRGPLSWGASGEAPADAEWLQVSDLGGLTGYLWAAYAGGELFLHLGETAPAGSGSDGVGDGSGYAGYCGEDELSYGVGRALSPAVYVVPMDIREQVLKTPGGAWRADLAWDVLACVYFRTSNTPGTKGYPFKHVTLWVVTAGNMLAFYTTATTSASGYNWAAFGSVTRCYGYDPKDESAGVVADMQETLGNVVTEVLGASSVLVPLVGIAPLPWQAGGGSAVYDDDTAAESVNLGTMNAAMVDNDGAFPVGQASMVPDGGIYFCPRLHVMSAKEPSVIPYAGFNVSEVQDVLYGGPERFGQYGGYYGMPDGPGTVVVPAFNLLFDPWQVEGLGLYSRGNYNFARVDAPDYLPPVATDWKRVAAATLQGPAGPVYVDIAGAETDGCLLTASASTENLT